MAVLLTGGTGKTSRHLARMLEDADIPFLVASRGAEQNAPKGMIPVKFDWLDQSTYSSPFTHELPGKQKITSAYIVPSPLADSTSALTSFIDLAAQQYGVKRFVLLGYTTATKDGPHLGKVWQHLDDIGVEYTVLRPTWFMENLSELQHKPTIMQEGKIYSACGDGKIPFVSARDIASVGFTCLTSLNPPPTDVTITGPEPLSYDEIALKLSSILGREIVHAKISTEQVQQRYQNLGLAEDYAKLLAWLEMYARDGFEATLEGEVEKVTGKAPQSFDDWAQENKASWQ
ncbi:hypothetical protein AAFC00_004497 [Neodothiora populina]|uniref:NmrA-like domain-containing protein n=1 Tax=Neodothiora populina TaxID=2781224 RepID=A0ABR3P276_9PEZI